jgi:hypothetical protein
MNDSEKYFKDFIDFEINNFYSNNENKNQLREDLEEHYKVIMSNYDIFIKMKHMLISQNEIINKSNKKNIKLLYLFLNSKRNYLLIDYIVIFFIHAFNKPIKEARFIEDNKEAINILSQQDILKRH